MRSETHISLQTPVLAIILAMTMLFAQACGQKPLQSGGNNNLGNIQPQTEPLRANDLFLDLCFGQDQDNDGVCDEDEELECVNDAYCEDDDDEIIDGLNGNYKKKSRMGRVLSNMALTAGAVAGGYGLIAGGVGATGLIKKDGSKKWGWLHNLTSKEVDENGLTNLRIINADGTIGKTDDLKIKIIEDSKFHKNIITNEPWFLQTNIIKLGDGHNFAIVLDPNKKGGDHIDHDSLAKVAGNELRSCTSGKMAFQEINSNKSVTINDQSKEYYQARISVKMKKKYTQTLEQEMTGDEFTKLCENNSGMYVALKLANSNFYFVNALPTSLISDVGIYGASNDRDYKLGFNVDYILRQKDLNPGPFFSNTPVTTDTEFLYRKYNRNGHAVGASHTASLDSGQVTNYNSLTSAQDRAKYLLAFSANPADANIVTALETAEDENATEITVTSEESCKNLTEDAKAACKKTISDLKNDIDTLTQQNLSGPVDKTSAPLKIHFGPKP